MHYCVFQLCVLLASVNCIQNISIVSDLRSTNCLHGKCLKFTVKNQLDTIYIRPIKVAMPIRTPCTFHQHSLDRVQLNRGQSTSTFVTHSHHIYTQNNATKVRGVRAKFANRKPARRRGVNEPSGWIGVSMGKECISEAVSVFIELKRAQWHRKRDRWLKLIGRRWLADKSIVPIGALWFDGQTARIRPFSVWYIRMCRLKWLIILNNPFEQWRTRTHFKMALKVCEHISNFGNSFWTNIDFYQLVGFGCDGIGTCISKCITQRVTG